MAVTGNKIYPYDQLLNVLESFRNGFRLEPDIRKQIIDTIRRSAAVHEFDLEPYEEWLQ